jgi:hypothetical protein
MEPLRVREQFIEILGFWIPSSVKDIISRLAPNLIIKFLICRLWVRRLKNLARGNFAGTPVNDRAVTVVQLFVALRAATWDIRVACEGLECEPVEDELFVSQLPIKSVPMPTEGQPKSSPVARMVFISSISPSRK